MKTLDFYLFCSYSVPPGSISLALFCLFVQFETARIIKSFFLTKSAFWDDSFVYISYPKHLQNSVIYNLNSCLGNIISWSDYMFLLNLFNIIFILVIFGSIKFFLMILLFKYLSFLLSYLIWIIVTLFTVVFLITLYFLLPRFLTEQHVLSCTPWFSW